MENVDRSRARPAEPVAVRAHFDVARLRADLLEMRAVGDRIAFHGRHAEFALTEMEIVDADMQRRYRGGILAGDRILVGIAAGIRPEQSRELGGDAAPPQFDGGNVQRAFDVVAGELEFERILHRRQTKCGRAEIALVRQHGIGADIDAGEYVAAAAPLPGVLSLVAKSIQPDKSSCETLPLI